MSAERDFSTRPRPRAANRWEVGALILGGVVLAWSAYATASAGSQLREARQAVERARHDAETANARIRSLEGQRRGTGESLASQVLFTADAPPPRVLADLEALLPADVRLESVSLSYRDRLDVDLQVAARRAASYDVFLERLARSPRFADLVPGAENRDGEVRASLRTTYRAEGWP